MDRSSFVVRWTVVSLLVVPPLAAADEAGPRRAAPARVLTLSQATALALEHHPELRVSAFEVEAQDGRVRQSRLLPNPELEATVEDVGGSGARRGFDDAQTTLLLSQRIELGRKRGRRHEAAVREREVAALALGTKRLDVVTQTRHAFVATLVAQERLEAARALIVVFRNAAQAAERQVRAGGTAPVEATRAALAVAQAEGDAAVRAAELTTARMTLAGTWGSATADFARVADDLERLPAALPASSGTAHLDDVPAVARARAESAHFQSTLALEQVRAVPDLTVGAGPRYYSDDDTAAVVFTVSMPLPFFDRNQGAVDEARARLAKARAEEDAARVAVRTALEEHLAVVRASGEQLRILHDVTIPQARAVQRDMQRAFGQGAVRSIEVLEAERTLHQLQDQYWTVFGRYHTALADVDRLTGSRADGHAEEGR